MPTMKGMPRLNPTETICVIALLFSPGISTGQNTKTQEVAVEVRAKTSESSMNIPGIAATGAVAAASGQGVFYAGGQLRIDIANSTLAEILTRLAALTGAKIEIPEGASAEQIPSLQLGPGPARQIVASLLSDSNFDYVIQGADTEPDKLQTVLLLPRGKRDNAPDVLTRPGRAPYARAAAAPPPPEEAPAPAVPSATQDQALTSSLSGPTVQPDQASFPASQPDLSAPPVFGQPLQTNVPKTFPVPPPATLDQQNINQTLQQMYQQRMQMQPGQQGASPAPPANR